MPARPGERYLPALALEDDTDRPRELGCGSPVSLTSPVAVIAAAELAARVVIDELTGANSLAGSLAQVLAPQHEPPYQQLGYVKGDRDGPDL